MLVFKIWSIACVFFLVLAQPIYGQNVQLDSLQLALQQQTEKPERIELLRKICSRLAKSDTAICYSYLDSLKMLATVKTDLFISARALHATGVVYSDLNKYHLALEAFNSAIDILKTSNENSYRLAYASVIADLSLVYIHLGDFDHALVLLYEAESILYMSNDYVSLKKVYSRIGDCFMQLGQEEKSFTYARKTLCLADKINHPESEAGCYVDYANSLVYQSNFDSAAYYYSKALSVAQTIYSPSLMGIIYYNIAFMNSKKENYPEAIRNYRKSYTEACISKILFDQGDVLYKIGLNLYYSERFKEAISVLDSALHIADSLKSAILKRNIYDVLTFLEYERGNFKEAWNYQSKYIDEANKVYTDNTRMQINILQVKYETRKKEAELLRLGQLQAKQKGLIKLLVVVFVLLVLVGSLTIKIIRGKKVFAEQKLSLEKEKVLKLEKEKQLVATQAVLTGEELERRRLARDLHDGLGGMLSGIKLKLSNMKGDFVMDSDTRKNFENAIESLDASVKEMRRVAHNLMPEVLVKFGINEALSDFCTSINEAGNIKTEYRFYGTAKRIDQNYEVNIYRIAQELVNNALKHARASYILVQFVQENMRLSLAVEDNGKGFDPKNIDLSKGIGLNNIISRVKALNGNIDINSAPETGTGIEVEFIL